MKSKHFKTLTRPLINAENFISEKISRPLTSWYHYRRAAQAYKLDSEYRRIEDLRKIPGSDSKILSNDKLSMSDWDYQREVEDNLNKPWYTPAVDAAYWVQGLPIGEKVSSQLWKMQVAECGYSDADVYNAEWRIVKLCQQTLEVRIEEVVSSIQEPGEKLEEDLIVLTRLLALVKKLLKTYDEQDYEGGFIERTIKVKELAVEVFTAISSNLKLLGDPGVKLSSTVSNLLNDLAKDLHGFPTQYYAPDVVLDSNNITREQSDSAFNKWRSEIRDTSSKLGKYKNTLDDASGAQQAWLWVGEHLQELWD